MEEYIRAGGPPIKELLVFVSQNNLDFSIRLSLENLINSYNNYIKPFVLEEYLKTTLIIVNKEMIRPTEEDVKKCIRYLKSNKRLICDKTVSDTVRLFLQGKLDITRSTLQPSVNHEDLPSLEDR